MNRINPVRLKHRGIHPCSKFVISSSFFFRYNNSFDLSGGGKVIL